MWRKLLVCLDFYLPWSWLDPPSWVEGCLVQKLWRGSGHSSCSHCSGTGPHQGIWGEITTYIMVKTWKWKTNIMTKYPEESWGLTCICTWGDYSWVEVECWLAFQAPGPPGRGKISGEHTHTHTSRHISTDMQNILHLPPPRLWPKAVHRLESLHIWRREWLVQAAPVGTTLVRMPPCGRLYYCNKVERRRKKCLLPVLTIISQSRWCTLTATCQTGACLHSRRTPAVLWLS